jgi:penicillin V acylase-like amidase (Ntn superfamily)
MCTRIFWNDNGVAHVVSRTFDWEINDQPALWALPRGLEREGGAGEGSATWTSRYGSIGVSSWDAGVGEGINEHGLTVHALYLDAAGYEAPDDRPTVSNVLVVQYALDNFRTVAEALDGLREVRIAAVEILGQHLPLHLALEDPSGDSAIVELLDGRSVVHHGREHRVMTNDPTYDEQQANLRRYAAFGGELPLPGDIVSADRFVRAAYFLSHLPVPADAADALAGVIGLARNCSVPYGAPDSMFDTYPTWWLCATDVSDGVFYFSSTRSPNVIWLGVDDVDLSAGAPALRLDPRDPALVGDVAANLSPAELPFGVPAAA